MIKVGHQVDTEKKQSAVKQLTLKTKTLSFCHNNIVPDLKTTFLDTEKLETASIGSMSFDLAFGSQTNSRGVSASNSKCSSTEASPCLLPVKQHEQLLFTAASAKLATLEKSQNKEIPKSSIPKFEL